MNKYKPIIGVVTLALIFIFVLTIFPIVILQMPIILYFKCMLGFFGVVVLLLFLNWCFS